MYEVTVSHCIDETALDGDFNKIMVADRPMHIELVMHQGDSCITVTLSGPLANKLIGLQMADRLAGIGARLAEGIDALIASSATASD